MRDCNGMILHLGSFVYHKDYPDTYYIVISELKDGHIFVVGTDPHSGRRNGFDPNELVLYRN